MQTNTFVVPGTLKRKGARKSEAVSLYLEADDREDALFQAHHGVIEMTVEKSFPGASLKYDLRRMYRLQRRLHLVHQRPSHPLRTA